MKRKLGLNKSEASDIIEDFLDGRGAAWDWDDFLSSDLGTPDLAAVQELCNKIALQHPACNSWCSDEGTRRLRALVVDLRAQAQPEDTVHLRGWESYVYRLHEGKRIMPPARRTFLAVCLLMLTPFALFGFSVLTWMIVHHPFVRR